MNKTVLAAAMALAAGVAALGAFAGEPAVEELFGERIYFPLGDKFESGSYMDYFCASWTGGMFRNLHGYKGFCVRTSYGATRPIKVEAGKTYRLTFKAYNEGMEKGYLNPTNNTVFPSFRFLDGTVRLKKETDWWKSVKPPKDWTAEGQLTKTPPPAEWKDYAITFTVPDGATMLCLGFSTIYRKANQWGPYCIADIDMKEVK